MSVVIVPRIALTSDADITSVNTGTGLSGGGGSGDITISLTTPVAIVNGGTGEDTANEALNAFLPSQTGNAGNVLTTDGTNTSWAASVPGDVTEVIAGSGLSGGGTSGSVTLDVNVDASTIEIATDTLRVKDLGITNAKLANATVDLTTKVTGALPIGNGGTGQTTANAGFNALSPMTTGGDLIYGGASGIGTRLPNGASGQYLTSAGTTAAPTWTTPTFLPLSGGTMSGDIAMGGNKITGLGSGTVSGDALHYGQIGVANGIAGLDGAGKVPVAQLPSSIMEFQGVWSAATNTPTLIDGTGDTGDVYRVNVAGTQDLGSGSQTFIVGDWVMYDAGGIWRLSHAGADAVVSVNGSAGVVTVNAINQLTGDATAGPAAQSQSQVITLATVNSNVGAFGSSTSIPTVTVNAKGLVTAASGNAVVAPAGTLTGTTLASNVVSSSLTSVGTITSGTWNGTSIAVANGGTGLTAGTSGGILGYTATGTLASSAALTVNQLIVGGGAGATPATLAAGTQYQVLRMGATTPAYGSINLDQAAAVTGTLPVGNGGTGATAFTQGSVVFAGASGVYTQDNANLFFDNTNNRLGVGTAAPATQLDVNDTLSTLSSFEGTAANANSSTAYSIPDLTKNVVRITLTGNATITLPATTGVTSNYSYSLTVRILQDGTGSRTLAWATAGGTNTINWDGGSALAPSSGAGNVTIYQFLLTGSETVWYGSRVWLE